jgi:hypothetical protein
VAQHLLCKSKALSSNPSSAKTKTEASMNYIVKPYLKGWGGDRGEKEEMKGMKEKEKEKGRKRRRERGREEGKGMKEDGREG